MKETKTANNHGIFFLRNNISNISKYLIWLVVSTHLKNISQNGNLPRIGVKIKNVWNHHPVMEVYTLSMVAQQIGNYEFQHLTNLRTFHHVMSFWWKDVLQKHPEQPRSWSHILHHGPGVSLGNMANSTTKRHGGCHGSSSTKFTLP